MHVIEQDAVMRIFYFQDTSRGYFSFKIKIANRDIYRSQDFILPEDAVNAALWIKSEMITDYFSYKTTISDPSAIISILKIKYADK